MKLTKISIIVPIYNEEKNISELYERLIKALERVSHEYELIFVNDGSKDGSLGELKGLARDNEKVKYLNFSKNFGQQIALTAGLDHCHGEAVVIIDGDLQDPPELIPDLYKKLKEGYQVVYAKREKRKGESLFKKVTSKIFYRFLRAITTIDIPLDTGDFRIMDQKIVEQLKKMPEHNKFLRGQIAWLGFKQTHVTFEREKRKHGKTGYSFNAMLKLAMDAITGFSDKPLRLVRNLGFFISLFSLIIILYALFSFFILNKTVTGWTSLIISTMFIGGIQLFAIGIIGEYISRINKNVIDRPLYIIEDSNVDQLS